MFTTNPLSRLFIIDSIYMAKKILILLFILIKLKPWQSLKNSGISLRKNIITPSNFENAQVEINGFYMI